LKGCSTTCSLDGGIRLFVSGGNTSEAAALTADEARRVHLKVIERVVPAGGTALVGVGGELSGAVREAEAALAAGAAGVMVHQPVFPYQAEEGLVRYFEALAASGAALVLYVRAPALPDTVLERVLALPEVVGLKYGLPDMLGFERMAALCRANGAVPLCGIAEAWAPFFWLAGARGFTSGLANLHPWLSLALLASLRAGDWQEAMRVRSACLPFEELRARHGNANNVNVVKAALAHAGLAGDRVRPPLAQLDPADQNDLEALLPALAEAAGRAAATSPVGV
jgi:4-hydroxy-tetrahydrodipicolinate synthase